MEDADFSARLFELLQRVSYISECWELMMSLWLSRRWNSRCWFLSLSLEAELWLRKQIWVGWYTRLQLSQTAAPIKAKKYSSTIQSVAFNVLKCFRVLLDCYIGWKGCWLSAINDSQQTAKEQSSQPLLWHIADNHSVCVCDYSFN